MTNGRFVATAHCQSMGGLQQRVRIGKHLLVADEPTSLGGEDAGPTPFGFVAGGLAACTAMTLQLYAERKGWLLGSLKVDVWLSDEGTTHVVKRTITFGVRLPQEQEQRLLQIAERTPMTKLLKRAATVLTELAHADGNEESSSRGR